LGNQKRLGFPWREDENRLKKFWVNLGVHRNLKEINPISWYKTGFKKGGFVGPAGFEPAAKRM
jgi:hypothetical protein